MLMHGENGNDVPIAEAEQQPAVAWGKNRQAEEARTALRDRTLGERIGDQIRARLHEMCRKVEIGARDYRERFGQLPSATRRGT